MYNANSSIVVLSLHGDTAEINLDMAINRIYNTVTFLISCVETGINLLDITQFGDPFCMIVTHVVRS